MRARSVGGMSGRSTSGSGGVSLFAFFLRKARLRFRGGMVLFVATLREIWIEATLSSNSVALLLLSCSGSLS